jgi:hypothetical protein
MIGTRLLSFFWAGIALVVFASDVLAERPSARQGFAYALSAAFTAETNCDLPGEVERAQRWVDRFRSGFDILQNKEDATLVQSVSARVEAQRRRMGTHAWCVEYRSMRNFSPFAY